MRESPRLFIRGLAGAALLGLAAAAAHAQVSPAEAFPTAEHARWVPARLDGLWCGTGPLREFSLQLVQRYQDVTGTLTRRGRAREITGQLHGSTLTTQSTRYGSLELQAQGNELRITGGEGMLALVRGTSFQRAPGGSCAA